MSIRDSDIEELVSKQVLSPEIAGKISTFYRDKKKKDKLYLRSFSRFIGVFLVSFGLLFFIVEGYGSFLRNTRLFLTLFPLFFAQTLCVFTYWMKRRNTVWSESSVGMLFLTIGLSFFLLGKEYNVSVYPEFCVEIAMVGFLPVVYLMRSHIGAILHVLMITFYVVAPSLWITSSFDVRFSVYWGLLFALIPYYRFFRGNHPVLATEIFSWILPLSLLFMLFQVESHFFSCTSKMLTYSFMSFFSFIYFVSSLGIFQGRRTILNGYRFIGVVGILFCFFCMTFQNFWLSICTDVWASSWIELFLFFAFFLPALFLGYLRQKGTSFKDMNFFDGAFIFFIGIFLLRFFVSPLLVTILSNAYLFFLASHLLFQGQKKSDIFKFSIGIVILSLLVVVRLFDLKLDFLMKGCIFVLFGLVIFFVSYRMHRRVHGL